MGPASKQYRTSRTAPFQLEPLESRRMLAGGPAQATTTQTDNSGAFAVWKYFLPNGGVVRFLVLVGNVTVTQGGHPPVKTPSLSVVLQDFGLANDADEFDAHGSTDQFQEIDGPGFKTIELHAVVSMHDFSNGVDFPLVLDLTWKLQGPWNVVHENPDVTDGFARFQGKSTDSAQVTGTAIAPEGDGALIALGANLAQPAAQQGTIFQDTAIIKASSATSDTGNALGISATVLLD